MKKLTGAILGLVAGFFVGYFLFAEDLSVSQVLFGADTGVGLFDSIGDNIMENARLKVLATSLGGLVLGTFLSGLIKK